MYDASICWGDLCLNMLLFLYANLMKYAVYRAQTNISARGCCKGVAWGSFRCFKMMILGPARDTFSHTARL
jgi:hypothetical protein